MGQIIKLTKSEFLRLMKNKATYIVIVLHIISIALIYVKYIHELLTMAMNGGVIEVVSSTNEYIYRPFIVGTLTGSTLFAIYLLINANWVKKNGSKEMVAAFMDERKHSFIRVMSFICVAILDTIICIIAFCPICMNKLNYLFSFKQYVIYPLLFMLPGLIMTIFLMEGLYRLSENILISMIVFVILTSLRFTEAFRLNPFVSWNFPQEYNVSDTVGLAGTVRLQIYTRVMLLLLAIGIWSLSVLFTRRYQYGPIRSFFISIRKPQRLAVSVVAMVLAVMMGVRQPFIDHAPLAEYGDAVTYQDFIEYAECNSVEKTFSFNTFLGTMKVECKMDIANVLSEDMLIDHNSGLKVKKITFNGEDIDFKTEMNTEDPDRVIMSTTSTHFRIPEGSTGELKIVLEGSRIQPRTAYNGFGYETTEYIVGRDMIYFVSSMVDPIGFTTENEKLYLNVPADHNPVANGEKMTRVKDNDDGTVCWETDEMFPVIMSGRTEINNVDYDNADVRLVYNSKNDYLIKKYNLNEAASDVLKYCDEHVGPLDTDEINRIKVEFLSSEIDGGYAIGGSAYVGESLLSADNLSNLDEGANANEIFMHEMVHLYFGDLGLIFEDDGLWSPEGLTVYTTYRIVREKYGELYADKYYADVWREAVKKQNNNFYLRHPEYMDKLPESYRNKIVNEIGTVNRYDRMPLMLLKAEEILGTERMDEVIQELYSHKDEHKMEDTCCTYQDFLDAAGLSEEDLKIE